MRKIFFLLSLTSIVLFAFSQGITNNAKIYVSEGAFIYGGNLSNATNGEITLNGQIEIEGNWTNNSENGAFTNIENTPNGTLIMNSTNETAIGGEFPTKFENLTINNNTKKIEITDNQINGVLKIDAPLNLNANKLIINNPETTAIEYISSYIFGETSPSKGLGQIEWHILDRTGIYEVPFGTGEAQNDLTTSIEITTAGDNQGYITFATYPTNAENEPLPEEVTSLTGIDAIQAIDRFWQIQQEYTNKPEMQITLSFTNTDIESNSNTDINDLKIFGYNSSE